QNALGSGALAVNGGTLDLNGTNLSVGTLSGSSAGLITSLVSGSAVLSVNQLVNAAYAGTITDGAGVVGLTKNGSAALFLTGSNSYTGTTTINSGNVRTGSGGTSSDSNNYALGTGDVVVNNGGMLSVRNSTSLSNNILISGTGATVGASGGAPLVGSFGAANQTAVVSGTVTLGGSTSISTWGSTGVTDSRLRLTGPIELGSNALTFTQCVTAGAVTSIEVNGPIRGTGSVIVDGTANVFATGSSSYTGGTTIKTGTVHTSNQSALGSGALAVNGGTLDLNGAALSVGTLSGSSAGLITSLAGGSAVLSVNQAVNATYAGTITDGAGVVGLTKSGTGQLFLTGSNSYTGTTTINSGNVRTGSGGTGDSSNDYAVGTGDVVVNNGGTLAVRNSTHLSNNIQISGTGATVGASGGAPLVGSFGASNQTAVVSGTVTLGGSTSISTWGSAGVTNSRLRLTGPIELGSNTLTFTQCVTAGAVTWIEANGPIRGTGSVIVDGTSTVYMNGANTYTGPTTVRTGLLGGTGSIAGAVIVESGATIAPGDPADATGILTVGSLQLAAGSLAALEISGTAAGAFDRIVSSGNVDFGALPGSGGNLTIDFLSSGFNNGDSWQLFSGSSFSGHLSSVTAKGVFGTLVFTFIGNGEWKATGGPLADGQSMSFSETSANALNGLFNAGQLVVVPEPSAIVIASIGLGRAGYRQWRRRRVNRVPDAATPVI
ncbi:MAG: beta strand repeat-containing protein, partial [Planctomycetia bacterium]